MARIASVVLVVDSELQSRRFRVAGVGFLTLLLLLAACSTSRTPVRLTPPAPSPAATQAGPQPVANPLGPVPTNCPSSPALETTSFAQFGNFSGPIAFHGGPVVWVPGPYFSTVLHIEQHLGYIAYPSRKIIWEVGPNYAQTVIVQVTNLATGQLAWWGETPPPQPTGTFSRTLTLDPTTQGPASPHGQIETGWQEYGSLLFIPQAGCYALDVTWPDGHWRCIFAAGF